MLWRTKPLCTKMVMNRAPAAYSAPSAGRSTSSLGTGPKQADNAYSEKATQHQTAPAACLLPCRQLDKMRPHHHQRPQTALETAPAPAHQTACHRQSRTNAPTCISSPNCMLPSTQLSVCTTRKKPVAFSYLGRKLTHCFRGFAAYKGWVFGMLVWRAACWQFGMQWSLRV